MRNFAKLALIVIFGITYLTSCGGTPTPKPIYNLNGVYALDYEISDIQGPEDFTIEDVEKKEIGLEFSTSERMLIFVEEHYPKDFNSASVNKSFAIVNNKSTLTDTFMARTDEQVTYTIDITIKSDDEFSYEELYEVKNSADTSRNRSFKRIGTGTKETLYKIADGTYKYEANVTQESLQNFEVGDKLSETVTFSGNTVSRTAFFSETPGTVTASIKYNRAVLTQTRPSDNRVCSIFLILTSDTTFNSRSTCINKDDKLILDASINVEIAP